MIVLASCHSQGDRKGVRQFPSDSTITPANRYTNLLLDSNWVRGYSDPATDTAIEQKTKQFYASRNYQFAWFHEEGLTEQASSFWSLLSARKSLLGDSSIYYSRIEQDMEALTHSDSILSKERKKDVEFNLTLAFFTYVNTVFNGRVDPAQLQWYIPRRKDEPAALLDSFINTKVADWKPLPAPFYRLRDKIVLYAKISKAGGWPLLKWPVEAGALKQRLLLTEDYNGDTTASFTPALTDAVKKLRRAYGLSPEGGADSILVMKLNVPVGDRLKQMLLNSERMRWLPEMPPDLILANIPEFQLHVIQKDSEVLNMRIVVGTAVNRTVIFSNQLKYVVFSPYWNVPPSIVRKEIVPGMKRNSSYLKSHRMEITGYSGGLPVVRQLPGKANSLGLVKFLFPNQYNIYFHDTPAKSLFEKDSRAFSHGCIRLGQPSALAEYLLRDDPQWTEKTIHQAMASSKEKWVTLRSPLPVFIVYFTSWVDKNGTLNFRDDLYGRDNILAKHLFP